MQLVYFGKKRPKKIHTVSPEMFPNVKINNDGITYIASAGEKREYNFEPFKAIEVDDEVAQILLDRAGDIFKRVDKDERKPDPKPVVKTDGYVGAVPADEIPNLEKQVKRDLKDEEGKDIEQIIDESKSKKKKKA